MTAEKRYRRRGKLNKDMTDAERKASIAAIKASARGKLIDRDRREDDHERAMKKNESVVSEYLESYFGGELNESTSDEDIMEAFYDLLETADEVEEYLQEISNRAIADAAISQASRDRSRPSNVKKGQLQRVMTKLARRGGGEEIKRYNRAVRHNSPNFTTRGQDTRSAKSPGNTLSPAGSGDVTKETLRTKRSVSARDKLRNIKAKRRAKRDRKFGEDEGR